MAAFIQDNIGAGAFKNRIETMNTPTDKLSHEIDSLLKEEFARLSDVERACIIVKAYLGAPDDEHDNGERHRRLRSFFAWLDLPFSREAKQRAFDMVVAGSGAE